MSRWKESKNLLPMLSGLLLAFAYFPFGLLVPNFIGFLPMLAWLDGNLDRPRKERLRATFVFGLTLNLMILHWMYAMLEISILAAVLYILLAALFAACQMGALTLAGWLRRETGWSYAFLLPMAWIPIEWAATWGDTRMTAHHVGHTLGAFPFLVQFADLVGPYGVGVFLLVANGILYDVLVAKGGRKLRPALGFLLLLGSVLSYDAWCWFHPPAGTGSMRIALVQPNIPLVEKLDSAQDEKQSRVLADLTRRAAGEKADLIVWPETARPEMIYHYLDRPDTYAMPEVQALARETGVAILTGAEYARIQGPKKVSYYNAAFLVTPDGRVADVWTAKVYLVPFVEKVPFEAILGPVLSGLGGELRWLGGGFRPGPLATPLRLGETEIGVLVCYEELYWDLARKLRNAGAGLQVIITNDAWFGRTVFQQYQANTVTMRAIESRCAFVRVANTGISGFVDPLGRYSQETAMFVPAVEVKDVPVTAGRTVYDRFGDFIAWLALGKLGVTVFMVRRRQGRKA